MKQALIVKGDGDVAEELRTLLADIGFDVTTLEEPAELTARLQAGRCEVALLDAKLPDAEWRRTLRISKNASPTTTVIVLAQSATEQDVRSALRAGRYAVLRRPLTQEQITGLVSPSNDGLFLLVQ